MENKIQEGIPLIKEWIELKRPEFENNPDFNELTKVINDIEKDQEATRASLRHEITYIYEKYKDKKVLPGNTKKDLCSLYEVYILLNGNSYVHEIYEEMMKWDTK